MRIVGIGGEPASGKSTLVKAFMASLAESPKPFGFGLVRGYLYPGIKLFILGIYPEGQVFGGTDRLSMAVQKQAVAFLDAVNEKYPEHSVLFEGDRLFNQSFLEVCREKSACSTVFLVLETTASEKARRHEARKDTQSEKFKRSRATKYSNIIGNCEYVTVIPNETEMDQAEILEQMGRFLLAPMVSTPTH